MEAERDGLRSELTDYKQQAAKQLAAARAEQEAASSELAEVSKQLRAALADVQRLQGRVSELETLHAQSSSTLVESSKAAAAAQVLATSLHSLGLSCTAHALRAHVAFQRISRPAAEAMRSA